MAQKPTRHSIVCVASFAVLTAGILVLAPGGRAEAAPLLAGSRRRVAIATDRSRVNAHR
jgi:hypothetical protein